MDLLETAAARSALRTAILAFLAAPNVHGKEDAPSARLDTIRVEEQEDRGYLEPAPSVASKTPRSRRQTPNSVSVLTREQMDAQQLVTVWDGLQQMTGVQALANDGNQAQYHARGSTVDLQIDGVPSSMPLAGFEQFDLVMYEQIELQRGSAGLLQGSGSFGGVVNLVRKRASGEPNASLLASAGSWNNYRTEVDLGSPLNEQGSLRARVVGSFVDREYFYDRVTGRRRFGYVTLEYDLRPMTTLSAFAAWQDNTTPSFTGLPTYTDGRFLDVPRSFNPYPRWYRNRRDTLELGMELRHDFGHGWQFVGKAARREKDAGHHGAILSTGVNPATNTATYSRRDFKFEDELESVDAFVHGGFELFGRKHELVVGFNESSFSTTEQLLFGVPSLDVTAVPLQDPPAVPDFAVPGYLNGEESYTRQQGLYAQASVRLTQTLTALIGGRLSRFSERARDIAPSTPTVWNRDGYARDEFTPYAGIVWDLGQHWSWYGSYSDIFVPQTAQRVSGEALGPRVGRQFETGIKADLAQDRLHVAAAVFNIRDVNRAYEDPEHPNFSLPLGEVESEGAELEVVGRPSLNWNIAASYAYLRTEYLRDDFREGQPISYQYPKHAFKLWTSYAIDSGAIAGLTLGAGINAYSGTQAGTATPTVRVRRQGSYALISLQAAYELSERTTAALTIGNLLDAHYYSRLGGQTSNYTIYGEPRSATLSVRWRY